MAMPCSSAALITSSSRIEPPGWITAVAPASIATSRPSANGKEGVRRHHRSLGRRLRETGVVRRVLGLARGDARGIDPAHLAGADADGGEILGIDDGVRFDVLGDAEGKAQIAQFGRRSARAWSPASASMSSTTALSRVCTSRPPATVLTVRPGARGSGRPPASSSRKFFFAADDGDRLLGGVRRDDDLGEDLGDGARGVGVERAVERDDAAEGRHPDRRPAPCDRRRRGRSPSATPHGLACLMMAQAAVRAGSNSATHS